MTSAMPVHVRHSWKAHIGTLSKDGLSHVRTLLPLLKIHRAGFPAFPPTDPGRANARTTSPASRLSHPLIEAFPAPPWATMAAWRRSSGPGLAQARRELAGARLVECFPARLTQRQKFTRRLAENLFQRGHAAVQDAVLGVEHNAGVMTVRFGRVPDLAFRMAGEVEATPTRRVRVSPDAAPRYSRI